MKTEQQPDAWKGFRCKNCQAPLAVRPLEEALRSGPFSVTSWRILCPSCGITDFYPIGSAMIRISTSPAHQ
jgi:RNase P subunit RPR2